MKTKTKNNLRLFGGATVIGLGCGFLIKSTPVAIGVSLVSGFCWGIYCAIKEEKEKQDAAFAEHMQGVVQRTAALRIMLEKGMQPLPVSN